MPKFAASSATRAWQSVGVVAVLGEGASERAGRRSELERELDVAAGGQVVEELALLGDQTDVATAGLEVGDVEPGEVHRSERRPFEPGEDP